MPELGAPCLSSFSAARDALRWPQIALVLHKAHERCGPQGRAALQLRLRRLLHECVAEGDEVAWQAALAGAGAAWAAEGPWSAVLSFVVGVEAEHLAAVSRSFARALKGPVAWETGRLRS